MRTTGSHDNTDNIKNRDTKVDAHQGQERKDGFTSDTISDVHHSERHHSAVGYSSVGNGNRRDESWKDAEFDAMNQPETRTLSSSDTGASNNHVPQQQVAGNGKAITSMILGICGLVFNWIPILGIGSSVAAVVLGVLSLKRKEPGRGMSLAGVITGGIGITLTVLFVILLILIFAIGIAGAASGSPQPPTAPRVF